MTQPVRRYEHPERVENHPEWHECDVGHYVTYTDYLALEAAFNDRVRVIEMQLDDKRALSSSLNAALAERDALRADARRYRWLRTLNEDRSAPFIAVRGPYITGAPVFSQLTGATADATIDSALATQEAG